VAQLPVYETRPNDGKSNARGQAKRFGADPRSTTALYPGRVMSLLPQFLTGPVVFLGLHRSKG
jgi:hypothetical protein